MSKPDKYVPTHRAPGKHKAVRAPRRTLRTTLVLTGVAAVATGLGVSGGLLTTPGDLAPVAATPAPTTRTTTGSASGATTMSPAAVERREQRDVVSRSAARSRTTATKTAALSVAPGAAVSRSENLSEGDPRDIARALLPLYGFDSSQFSCLDSLYVSESNWRVDADNASSSAYGIPQALTQLHDLPADYMTSAESQIRWGLDYIRNTYGSPCGAWSFKAGNGWY
ncbi:MAG: lytic transglycosylase domain-containing protein [Nocardioides sp.]|nr:lytic transglycosylase domain-containing protein [Nocardioides sp.]